MSVVSVSTVFSSNSAALGLNDRVASFMDHLFATGVGLSTRYFIDLVTGHDLKLVGSLIGIWEGIVMQHFVKRNRRSRKVFDPYLAFAVRLFLDYALTQDPSRLALTVVWSCLGWVLADLVPQVLKELGLGGFWKSIERDLDNLSRSIPSIPATSGSRSTRVHSSSRPPSHVTEVRSMSMASYPTTITPVSSHGSSFTRSQPATAVRRRPPGALPGYASSNTTGMTPQASMRSPDYNSSQSASLSSLSFSGPSLLGTAHATSHFTYTTQHTGTRTRGHDASTRFTDDLDGENLSSSTSSAGSASTRIATIDRSGIHPGDIPDEELEIPISQSPGGSFVTPVRRIQGHLPTPSATASVRHSRQGPSDPELRQSIATEEPPSFADMRTIRTMPSGKTLKELEGSPSRGSRHTSIASPSRSIHTSPHHEEVADQAPVAPLTPPKKVSNPRDVPTPASAGKSSTTPSGIPRIRQPQPPQRKASVGSGVPSVVPSIPEPQPQPPPQPQPVQAPIPQRISQVQQQDTQTPVETTVSPAPLPIPPAQGRGSSHHERAPSALASSASADNQAQQQQPPPSSQSRIPLPTPVKAQSVVVGPTSSGKGKEREPADKAASVVSMPALSKSQTKGGSGQSQKPVDNAPAPASAPAPPAATANKGISRPPSTTGVPPPPPATEPQPQSQPKSKSQAEAPSQAQGEQAPKPQPPAAEAKPSGKGKDKDKEKEKEKEKNATSSTPAPAPAAAAPPTTSKPGSGGPTSRIPSASHTRAATPVVGTTTSEAVAEQSQQMRSSAAPQRPPSRQASEQQKQQQPRQQKPQERERERERRQSQPSQPPPVSSTTPQPPPQPKKKTSFWGSLFGGDGEGGNDTGGGSNTGAGAGTSGSAAAPRPSASAGPGHGPGPAAPVQRKSSSSQLGAGRAGSSRTAPAAGAAAGATQAQTRQSQMSMQSTSALGLVGIEPPRSQSTVITQAELEAEEAARLAEADADIEDAEVLTQRGKGRAQSQVPTQILRRSLVGALDDSSSSSDGPASTGKDSLTTEPDVTQDRLVRALELTRKAVQLNKVISELNFRRSEAMALGKEGVGEMRSIQQEIRKAENKKEKLNGRIESVFKEVNVLDEPPEVLDLSGAGQDPSLSPVQDALEQLLYPGTVSNTIQVKLAKKGGTSSKQRDKLKEFLTELQLEYSYDAPARLMIIKVPNASES